MNKKFDIYVSPLVEIIEIQCEKGFATSGSTDGFGESDGKWN